MLLGLLCIAFFLFTDPRVLGARAPVLGWSANPMDAAFDATVGTLLGLAGAAVVIVIGMWLVSRREF